MAAFVYNNERGARSAMNTLTLPTAWEQLRAANGFPAQTAYDDNFFSFTANAFVNRSTGEIVISYKGTDFLIELSGRVWNTIGDIVTDVSAGIGGFVSTAQFVQAATYYQQVKNWATAHGYDTSNISFTGHSLGGGIASVMSAWFNRPATTFAEAPFEATVSSPHTVPAIKVALLAMELDRPALVAANGERLPLNPGMLVSAEINQGRRSVIDYLLSPVQQLAQEAARER
jgi:hypothetical protein